VALLLVVSAMANQDYAETIPSVVKGNAIVWKTSKAFDSAETGLWTGYYHFSIDAKKVNMEYNVLTVTVYSSTVTTVTHGTVVMEGTQVQHDFMEWAGENPFYISLNRTVTNNQPTSFNFQATLYHDGSKPTHDLPSVEPSTYPGSVRKSDSPLPGLIFLISLCCCIFGATCLCVLCCRVCLSRKRCATRCSNSRLSKATPQQPTLFYNYPQYIPINQADSAPAEMQRQFVQPHQQPLNPHHQTIPVIYFDPQQQMYVQHPVV